MRLAEALSRRSDAQKRYQQLRSRIEASARYQEGEEPPEDAGALVTEALALLDELEDLIRRINQTNAASELEPGRTITDGIAERDVLRLRHALLSGAAGAAAGTDQRSYRQLRSELREIAALSVGELRTRADDVAERLRRLDTRIQQRNWEVDLLD
ncbi:MAG TPA: DIP1984 family protein [Iamia sp.]